MSASSTATGERPSLGAATLADSSVHGQFGPVGSSYLAAPGDGRSPTARCRMLMGKMHPLGMKRFFLIGAFSIIGGCAGAGVASMVLTIAVNQMPKSRGIEVLAGGIPWLASGAALGFVAAFLFGWYLFKDRPVLAQAEVEQKYIGGGGRWRVYAGCPMFLFAVLLMTTGEKVARIVGEHALPYVIVLTLMVIVGISLYLYDRIPRSLILPVGLLGWMLLIGFGCWYCWFGPGAFGHHH